MPAISTLVELTVTSISSLQQRHWTQHILIIHSVHICKSEASELMAHSCRSLSRFLSHEASRSISTPPGWDASPSQVTPPQFVRFPQQFASTHLYSWVERGTVRVKCLAQEHNTVSPARAQTWTAHSRDEHTNHTCTHILYWLSRI